MKFGCVPVSEAPGATLAHTIRAGDRIVRKGTVLDAETCAALMEAGVLTLAVARLETGDVPEDEAAKRLVEAAAGPGLRVATATTGRCNLHACAAGVLRVDAAAVDAANGIDEALTLATPPDHARLEEGQLAATAKIIPYAAPGAALSAACAALAQAPLVLHPFRPRRVALLLTQLPGQKDSLVSKGAAAVHRRLSALGSEVAFEARTAHDAGDLAEALVRARASAPEIVLILAGSATSDRQDVAPAAIVQAGGRIDRFGMPVDPGNLLVLGVLDGPEGTKVSAIVLPGCARSPALNGADWVLERLCAGLPVTGTDVARMGVGGLLKEIPSRPRPREAPPA